MKKQYWLINLRSGQHQGAKIAEALRGIVTVVPIDFSRLHEQIAAAADHEQIVVAGGDGTFASVLTSPTLPDLPVGLVSLGTANDLAREVGTLRLLRGKRWEELPAIISSLPERALSTWNVSCDGQQRSFCNYLSLGFEGAVVADFDRWRSASTVHNRVLNRVMYVWFGLRHLTTRIRGAQVSADGSTLKSIPATRGIILANIKSHMGCGFATRESNPGDSQIECVKASSPLDYLRMVACPLGLLPSLRSMCRGSQIEVTQLPVGTAIQLDGEASCPILSGGITVSLRSTVRVLSAG